MTGRANPAQLHCTGLLSLYISLFTFFTLWFQLTDGIILKIWMNSLIEWVIQMVDQYYLLFGFIGILLSAEQGTLSNCTEWCLWTSVSQIQSISSFNLLPLLFCTVSLHSLCSSVHLSWPVCGLIVFSEVLSLKMALLIEMWYYQICLKCPDWESLLPLVCNCCIFISLFISINALLVFIVLLAGIFWCHRFGRAIWRFFKFWEIQSFFKEVLDITPVRRFFKI